MNSRGQHFEKLGRGRAGGGLVLKKSTGPRHRFARALPVPLGVSETARWNVVSSLHCMTDPRPEGHMASYIERRKFLAALGGAAVAAAWPLMARAQQPGKQPTIGLLGSGTA